MASRTESIEVTNDAARAEFWKEFILSSCLYPAPERLGQQLARAAFGNFCACGCNGFGTSFEETTGLPPLTAAGKSGLFFEADFELEDGRQLEVMLFSDEEGNLAGVDVDCQGNTEPVPDDVRIAGAPVRVYASDSVLR